jgi:dihydroorotate dehydrogenase (fumarate)
MDLRTQYLGLELAHPFMPGASPLVDDLDSVLRLEDAGAAAIVMHSLFAEQTRSLYGAVAALFPAASDYALDPNRYIDQLHTIKQRVGVPVIASLNGTGAETWLKHASLIEQAGADALEVNCYHVVTDLAENAAAAEHRVTDIVAVLKESVRIPLAVKLSAFYSALPNLAWRLDQLGADGLILFNRFFQPDFDPEALASTNSVQPSDRSELLLRLHWLAILSGRLSASLAVSGGVNEPIDAVKAVLAGADGVQMVSALMEHGPQHLAHIRREFEIWADGHGYATIGEMRGRMYLGQYGDPSAFERGSYLRLLQRSPKRPTRPPPRPRAPM